MDILITGYAGFIGQNITEALQQHKLTLIEKDDEIPNLKNFDWVIHLGAESSTTTSIENAMKYNYEYSVELYEQCKKHNVNLQWASSASVYGNNNTTFKETDTPNPESPYAWSKYLFERYIEQNPSNIIVQGFRYFNVYGKHEEHKGNMASPYHQFTQQAKKDGVIKLFEGSDNFYRDFIPVVNVVEWHLRLLTKNVSGIFNVGSGKVKSFLDVAKEIQKWIPCKIEYIPFPEHLKGQYQEYTCANIYKIKRLLL